jgi:hypothetical protein
MKKYIYLLVFCGFCLSLSSCYKENNPNDGNFDIIGDIAQVSSMTAPAAAPANSKIDLVIRLNFLNTNVKEFRFYQRIGTTGTYVATVTVPFAPNFVAAERVHVVTVPYTVPNEKGKTFSLQVEAVTDNNLVSSRRTTSPTNITIQ